MKVSGFTYIRDGLKYGYPFLESVRSLLPLCDEVIIAVGDSTDKTRQKLLDLGSPKIRIIDTIWDDNLRKGGHVFAQQANIALDHASGDWAIHLQADEVLHENDYEKIHGALEKFKDNEHVEGVVLDFLNFYGDYNHIAYSRNWHRREVRIIRPLKNIRSYKDSQGFRFYPGNSPDILNLSGRPLKVFLLDVPVYHYSYVRPPGVMQEKALKFHSYWHGDLWLEQNIKGHAFDYQSMIDYAIPYTGPHPAVMKDRLESISWQFSYDHKMSRKTLKDVVLHFIEQKSGWRIGEYRNYRVVKSYRSG